LSFLSITLCFLLFLQVTYTIITTCTTEAGRAQMLPPATQGKAAARLVKYGFNIMSGGI
jgi:hypothetical protein